MHVKRISRTSFPRAMAREVMHACLPWVSSGRSHREALLSLEDASERYPFARAICGQ